MQRKNRGFHSAPTQPQLPPQLHKIGTSQLGNYVKLWPKLWLIQVGICKWDSGARLVIPTSATTSCRYFLPQLTCFRLSSRKKNMRNFRTSLSPLTTMPPQTSRAKPKPEFETSQPNADAPPKRQCAPDIQWAKNPNWTDTLLEYLHDNVAFQIKLFSDSTADATKQA